ncbi:MFS transporter [Streptomyces sp. NPDC091272]|uniref:MFS transporter n=1 Tax=Streptomyces sp. NPDC091272 TaxID=3365981 RepID=UPI0037F363C9
MTSPADPPPSAAARRRPSWASRNYSLLTASAVVTNLGSNGALIAASFAVLAAGGTAGDVGLVAAARTVPLILFLLIGGAVADRLPRHRVMVAANALNCVSQGLFAFLVLTGSPGLWQMMLLAGLGGAAQAFFNPAAEGMLLSTVTGEQAGRAFAVFRMATQGAAIGGTALGGAMIAAVGPGWVLAIDAAAFAVAGAMRAFLDVKHIPERVRSSGMLSDLREGWQEVASRPWLWGIVGAFSAINAVVAAAEAVYGPLVAEEHLGGAAPWGFALAGFGAGTVLGAVVMMRWKPRRLLFSGLLCVFPLALPSAGLAVPLPAWTLVAVMFVTGVSLEMFGVSWMTALHQEIPEEKFSRVSSYDWLGSLAMVPIATSLAGPAENAFGRSNALWGSAALIVVLTVAMLMIPDVRNLRRRSPDPVLAAEPATPGPPPEPHLTPAPAPSPLPSAQLSSPDAEGTGGRLG